MRQSARLVALSVSLVLLAACGTAPTAIELQPLQKLDQVTVVPGDQSADQGKSQVMGQSDLKGLLSQAAEAAKAGDKARVLSLLKEARDQLGSSTMASGGVGAHINQAISQLDDTRENVREVASILVSHLQDSLKATQDKP